MAMGGQAEAITGVLRTADHRPDMSLGEALQLAVEALGSVGGEDGAARSSPPTSSRWRCSTVSRAGRTFRRITGAALA